jgi:hypothetical protein
MKKLLLFLFTFGLLISTSSTAEIVLYCNDEMATGFTKENGNGIWRKGNFTLDRYTIRFSDDYSEVKGLDSSRVWQCKDSFQTKKYNTVICSSNFDAGEMFTYNKNTQRFVFVKGTAFGFVANGVDTDIISGGTCQKF